MLSSAGNALDWALRSFPDERERLRPYVDRAEAYRNECGCSMGGAFAAASLVVMILYALLIGFSGRNPATVALGGASLLFSAGVLGKLTGIAIARLRLRLLYRRLRLEYAQGG